MSLWQIAARNVWQNRGRYVAYLASSAFGVMIYFLYSALAYHPELQSGYNGAGYVVQGMKAASVVIAIFTFLFLLYSSAAFVRGRMKEFGLLSLLGVSRGQLAALVVIESMMVGTVAVAAGLSAGLLFLKLFFMAISALLRLPEQIPVYVGARVWLQTLGVFGTFFVVVSLASLREVLRRNIIELVRAGRQPKGAPTFSRVKAALGLLLVVGGYVWASFPHPMAVVMGIVPVTTMVSLGTYLLIQEGSIAFLTWLHRRERFFYRPGPFLNVTQLVYKMQDNYRVLSAVAVLVAVILTAMGTAYTLYDFVAQDAAVNHPQAVQLAVAEGTDPSADVARVQAILEQHGVADLTRATLATRRAQLEQSKRIVVLVPYSFYAGVDRADGKPLPPVGDGEAILVYRFGEAAQGGPAPLPADDHLLVGERRVPVRYQSDYGGPVLNATPWEREALVLPDAVFHQLVADVPTAEARHYTVWRGQNWKSRALQRADAELTALYPAGGERHLTTGAGLYLAGMNSMGLVLFIGGFVSLVFFAACFSLLYSRLFTEVDEDRRYLRRLQQVGVSNRELRRLAVTQAAVIFFVPFLGGLLHSTFAMQALGTLMKQTVLQNGWLVAAGYLVLYGVCFRATCSFYWRSLQAGLGGRHAA